MSHCGLPGWKLTSMLSLQLGNTKWNLEHILGSQLYATIVRSHHFFRLYKSDRYDFKRRLFVTARNVSKRVLNEAKLLFVNRIKQNKFGSRDYCWLRKSLLNNSKSSIPHLFKQTEVLTSTEENVKCFSLKFSPSPITCLICSNPASLPHRTEDMRITP